MNNIDKYIKEYTMEITRSKMCGSRFYWYNVSFYDKNGVLKIGYGGLKTNDNIKYVLSKCNLRLFN